MMTKGIRGKWARAGKQIKDQSSAKAVDAWLRGRDPVSEEFRNGVPTRTWQRTDIPFDSEDPKFWGRERTQAHNNAREMSYRAARNPFALKAIRRAAAKGKPWGGY